MLRALFKIGAVALLTLFFNAPVQAQKTFKVCRGEDIAKCGIDIKTDAFVGCSDPTAYMQNACPRGVGAKSIRPIMSHDGNRCGYTVWEVTCNEEIAPHTVLQTLGLGLPALFAIVGIVGAVGLMGGITIGRLTSPEEGKDPGRLLRWGAAIGGVLGIIVAGIWAYYQLNQVTPTLKLGLLEFLLPSAFAAGDEKPESMAKLYVAMFVLALIGAAFLAALVALFVLPHNKANEPRIKAADNIVKMFGGFFTGLATTLLTKF